MPLISFEGQQHWWDCPRKEAQNTAASHRHGTAMVTHCAEDNTQPSQVCITLCKAPILRSDNCCPPCRWGWFSFRLMVQQLGEELMLQTIIQHLCCAQPLSKQSAGSDAMVQLATCGAECRRGAGGHAHSHTQDEQSCEIGL